MFKIEDNLWVDVLLIQNRLTVPIFLTVLVMNSLRSRRDSNPRPPAWQAGALTNCATEPMFDYLADLINNITGFHICLLLCYYLRILGQYPYQLYVLNGARRNRTTDTQGFNLLLYLTELSRLNAPIISELVDISKSIHGSVPFLFQRTSHRYYTD